MTDKRSDAGKKAAATRKKQDEAAVLAEQGSHAPEGAPALESPEAPGAPPTVGELSHPLDRNASGFTQAPVDAHAPKWPPAA